MRYLRMTPLIYRVVSWLLIKNKAIIIKMRISPLRWCCVAHFNHLIPLRILISLNIFYRFSYRLSHTYVSGSKSNAVYFTLHSKNLFKFILCCIYTLHTLFRGSVYRKPIKFFNEAKEGQIKNGSMSIKLNQIRYGFLVNIYLN